MLACEVCQLEGVGSVCNIGVLAMKDGSIVFTCVDCGNKLLNEGVTTCVREIVREGKKPNIGFPQRA